jgi:8-oxo-dGTP diphosphatase
MIGPYRPIVATLGYVVDPTGQSVLLVHRNARADDTHLGKYNGLGGKIEPHEGVVTCLRRELREEAGIELVSFRLRGTVNWPGFGADGEDWLGFIFLIDGFTGDPLARNPEGDLTWVPIRRLLAACAEDAAERAAADLPLWEGDRAFVPLVFDADPAAFHGVMPYEGGRPVGWAVERC